MWWKIVPLPSTPPPFPFLEGSAGNPSRDVLCTHRQVLLMCVCFCPHKGLSSQWQAFPWQLDRPGIFRPCLQKPQARPWHPHHSFIQWILLSSLSSQQLHFCNCLRMQARRPGAGEQFENPQSRWPPGSSTPSYNCLFLLDCLKWQEAHYCLRQPISPVNSSAEKLLLWTSL